MVLRLLPAAHYACWNSCRAFSAYLPPVIRPALVNGKARIAYHLVIKTQIVCCRINADVVTRRKKLSAILNSEWYGDYLRVSEINIYAATINDRIRKLQNNAANRVRNRAHSCFPVIAENIVNLLWESKAFVCNLPCKFSKCFSCRNLRMYGGLVTSITVEE